MAQTDLHHRYKCPACSKTDTVIVEKKPTGAPGNLKRKCNKCLGQMKILKKGGYYSNIKNKYTFLSNDYAVAKSLLHEKVGHIINGEGHKLISRKLSLKAGRDFLQVWCKGGNPRNKILSPKTQEVYLAAWDDKIKDFFFGKFTDLNQATAADIKAFFLAYSSSATYNKPLSIVIKNHPASSYKLKESYEAAGIKPKANKREVAPGTVNLELLYTLAKEHSFMDFVGCKLIFTSLMRIGAVRSLQWKHIKFDTNTIADVPDKHGKLTTTYFNEEVKELLQKWHDLMDWNDMDVSQTAPVFRHLKGQNRGKVLGKNFNFNLGTYIKTDGVVPGKTAEELKGYAAHAMRHLAAGSYMQNGGKLGILQEVMSHATPEQTMQYVKFGKDAVRAGFLEVEK